MAKLERYPESERYFSSAILLNNRIPEIWNNMGVSLYYQKKYVEALHCVDKALSLAGRNTVFMNNKALFFYGMGDYNNSMKYYNETLMIDKANTVALIGIASIQYILNNRDESLRLLNKVVDIDPNDDNALYNLGVIYDENGDPVRGLNYLDRSLRSNPDNVKSLIYKAKVLRQLAKYEETLEVYDRLLELDSKNFMIYFNKGTALAFMGKPKESIVYFDRASELNPTYLNAIINKSESFRQMEKYDQSLLEIEKVLVADGSNLKALEIKGRILFQQLRYADAELVFRKALELSKRNDLLVLLISSLSNQGKYLEAISVCNRELSSNPTNTCVLLERGAAYVKNGDTELAEKDFDEVLRINPNEPYANYNKAALLQQRLETSQALIHLKRAIDFEPDLANLSQADPVFEKLRDNEDFVNLSRSFGSYSSDEHRSGLHTKKSATVNGKNVLRQKILPAILQTCKCVDIGALALRHNDGNLYYVTLRVRFTAQDKKDVELMNSKKKLNAPFEQDFQFHYEVKDIGEAEIVLNSIENGEFKINDVLLRPLSTEYSKVFSNNNLLGDNDYTTSSERQGYPHKILVTHMSHNAVKFVEDREIDYKKYSNAFSKLGFYLGIKDLNSANNCVLLFPYYCKFIDLAQGESNSYLAKVRIHEQFVSRCYVSFEMSKDDEPLLDRIMLRDCISLRSSENHMKDILIPMPNIENVKRIEARIIHDIIGELTSKSISLLQEESDLSEEFAHDIHKESQYTGRLSFGDPERVQILLDLSLKNLIMQEESEILEFKASMRYDHDKKGAKKEELEHEVAKAIAGFMNTEGGLLFIGIRPKTVVGLADDFGTISNGNYDRWYQRLSDVIHLDYEIESVFKSYYNVVTLGDINNPVVVVKVGKSPKAVWMRHKDRNGIKRQRFYIRRNNQTTQLHDRDLYEYIKSHFPA